MENIKELVENIVEEVSGVLRNINYVESERLIKELSCAKNIFVSGTGRSGLVGKIFGMRLMHSGYNVFIVGETNTPSITEKDALLIISGSGSTSTLNVIAQKAKKVNASICLITTNTESVIAKVSNVIMTIPAATKKKLTSEPKTIQPLGNQFDQSAHLLLDAICIQLSRLKKRINQLERHANLE